mgnify:CR=1 FL=1
MKNKTETFCQNDKQQINQLLTINSKKKMKNLFLTGLLGLGVFCSCSNEDDPANYGNQQNEGTAYTQIMINIASTSATRTNTAGKTGESAYGEDEEYTIGNIRVVFADPTTNIAKYIYDPEMKDATNASDDDKGIRVTKPFLVEAGEYNVYVLANYAANQSYLSPIIANSTDMKQAFTITNAAGLATSGKFFMTNSEVDKYTLQTTDVTGKEVDDAGQEVSSGQTVNLLAIDIERVVSKVTFNNADNAPFEVKSGNDIIANATLEGVSLINLNKKMYLVKEKDNSVNPQPTPWGDYFYVKDPNYDKTLTGASDETTWLSDNFSQSSATGFTAPNAAKLYCPENTMTATAQQNGQTTGVVYKVKYTPTDNRAYSVLDKDGTDTYSQIYAKLLADPSYDEDITDNMFTTAVSEDENFYEYNGFIFKTKNAAILYYTIDKAVSKTTDDENIATINSAFTANKTSVPADVHTYTEGYCYYTVWIKHNPSGSHMESGKFGTVRNHWYELTVKSIKGLGNYKPTYKDPKDPDEEAKANIQVEAKIKKWVLVKQDVTLE